MTTFWGTFATIPWKRSGTMPAHEGFGRRYSGRNASLDVRGAVSCIQFGIHNALFNPKHRHGPSVTKLFAGTKIRNEWDPAEVRPEGLARPGFAEAKDLPAPWTS